MKILSKLVPLALVSLLISLTFAAEPVTFRLVLGKKTVVDQNDVQTVKTIENTETNSWEILLSLNPKGTERLKKITAENMGKKLKIVVDGKIVSAPVIQTSIENGHVAFTSHYSYAEAEELATRIQSGILAPKSPPAL
jgi:preprotein translocase subunit SecD